MVLGSFNWCSVVLGGSGCGRILETLIEVVVGCFRLCQVLGQLVSSGSVCFCRFTCS